MHSIAFVTTYPLEHEPVIKNRLMPFLEVAGEKGYAVVLVSPDEGEVPAPPGVDHFTHVPVGLHPFGKAGFFMRAIKEATLARKLLRQAKESGAEDIFITIPSMFLLFLSVFLGHQSRHLDIRDLSWEYLPDASITLRSAKWLFRRMAKLSVRSFANISVTNATEWDYAVSQFGLDENRLLLIPNGISRRQFNILSQTGVRTVSDAKGDVTVSYIGNVGLAQNLVLLLKAARRLPDLSFNIVGGGNDLERVGKTAREMGVPNVSLYGRVAWDEIPKIYQRTDILYAQLSKEFAGAMPSKIYEYLATGKFVIYGGIGQAPDILRQFDNNTIIPPDDEDALVQAIEEAVSQGKHAALSDGNVKKISEIYIREARAETFFDQIEIHRTRQTLRQAEMS